MLYNEFNIVIHCNSSTELPVYFGDDEKMAFSEVKRILEEIKVDMNYCSSEDFGMLTKCAKFFP